MATQSETEYRALAARCEQARKDLKKTFYWIVTPFLATTLIGLSGLILSL